jgi:hypothetical protein
LSIRFEVKRTLYVSQEKAYKGLVDLDSAKHWMQGLVGIEQLDEGPL